MYRTIPTTIKTTTTTTTTTRIPITTPTTTPFSFPSTTPSTTISSTTSRFWDAITSTLSTTTYKNLFNYRNFNYDNNNVNVADDTINVNGSQILDSISPQSLIWNGNGISNNTINATSLVGESCRRINIMGTIVQNSAPYLYPFIIEYSLIGAAVIYVMWKHIGRYPKYVTEEDLEHRLEVMLSRSCGRLLIILVIYLGCFTLRNVQYKTF